MHKVIFKRKAINIIEEYIISYKNIYFELYSDTGIYYEELIKQNYIQNADKFYFEIRNNINNLLQEKTIYGYKILDNNNFQITIITGNYRLFVEYSENEKERFVENIIFNQK